MLQISTRSAKQEISTICNGRTRFGRLLASVSSEEHGAAFADWLQLNLELQLADLEEFLSLVPDDQRIPLEARLAGGFYADLVPQDALRPERLLFLTDLETVLELRQIC